MCCKFYAMMDGEEARVMGKALLVAVIQLQLFRVFGA